MLITEEFAISTENFEWKNIPSTELTIIFGFGNSELTFERQVKEHDQLDEEDLRLFVVSNSNQSVFIYELIWNQTVYFEYFFSQ